MNLVIDLQGTVRCLYDEQRDLSGLGQLSIRRGAHVEPDRDGRWSVDLCPVHGPRLGPFALRSDALAAQRDWLNDRWLLQPPFT